MPRFLMVWVQQYLKLLKQRLNTQHIDRQFHNSVQSLFLPAIKIIIWHKAATVETFHFNPLQNSTLKNPLCFAEYFFGTG